MRDSHQMPKIHPTPFQKIERKNLFQKLVINERIKNNHHKQYDFNINTHLMKDIDINDINNIENILINDINNSHYDKNLDSNFQLSNDSEKKKNSKKNHLNAANVKSSIKAKGDFNCSDIESASVDKSKKHKNKNDKNIQITSHNFFSGKDILANKMISKGTENTKYYFYHKNTPSNSEVKNYFRYKKGERMNFLLPSSVFMSKTKRILTSKEPRLDKNTNYGKKLLEGLFNENAIKKNFTLVTRKHSSLMHKDLSQDLKITKLN